MIRRQYLKNQRKAGFTILEVVLSLGLMVIIVGALGVFSGRILNWRPTAYDLVSTQDQINRTMAPLVTELRSMQPSNTGGYSLESADTSTLVFYSDTNHDGLVERIRYFLDGSKIKKGVVVPSGNPISYGLSGEAISTILDGVTPINGKIFSYYGNAADLSGAALNYPLTISSVRTIRISFSLDLNGQELPPPVTVDVSATPRNLRGN